jgi:glycosyltransferase involved in cell wall biosynthesis
MASSTPLNSQPLVSVIVPCYNHEAYVAECIQSVLNQSYSNIELIVIDDGSKDNSVEVIQKLRSSHPFIFETQKNKGLSATLNKAITTYATGKYIAIIASDDFWDVHKIKLQVNFMEKHPEMAMCCSKAAIVNQTSEIIGEFDAKSFRVPYSFSNIALGKSFVAAVTVLTKKEIYDSVGLFDETLLIEDLDMWLRIADVYPIGYINEVTAFYRQHESNTSSRLVAMTEARFRILDKWKHKGAVYRKMKRNFELLALSELGKDFPNEAKKYLHVNPINFFHAKYRKFILKYFFTGQFV